MPLEWNGTRKYSSVTIRSLPESKTKPDAHCVHRSVSWSISTPSRIPSLLSWSDIDPSSFPREIRRKVEDIILQPCTKPWEDVHMIRPELYQIIMDSLQVVCTLLASGSLISWRRTSYRPLTICQRWKVVSRGMLLSNACKP